MKGRADGWYDIANGKTYYRVTAACRVRIAKDRHFAFACEKGSGAPNFNKGNQFSANITVTF